jgi:hypothetical protein
MGKECKIILVALGALILCGTVILDMYLCWQQKLLSWNISVFPRIHGMYNLTSWDSEEILSIETTFMQHTIKFNRYFSCLFLESCNKFWLEILHHGGYMLCVSVCFLFNFLVIPKRVYQVGVHQLHDRPWCTFSVRLRFWTITIHVLRLFPATFMVLLLLSTT